MQFSNVFFPTNDSFKVDRPNKEKHEEAINEINASIDKLKGDRQKLHNKIDNLISNRGNTAVGKERDALQKLRSKKVKLIEEKKAIRSRLDATRNQTDRLLNDRKATKASVKYTNLNDIEAEIAKLARRQETTSMSLSEEKRLIKEMDALQASKKLVVELKSKDVSIDNAKEQRKLVTSELHAKDKQIDAVQKEMDERSAAIKKLAESENETKEKMQKMFDQKDSFRSKIGEKMKEKDQLWASFREANDKYYDYQRALKAQRKIKYEEEKMKREEEKQAFLKKKEEEEAKKVPYEEEMSLCDYLADYLTRTYLSDAKKSNDDSNGKKDVVEVKDDPFAGFKPINKKSEDVFLQMGGKQKKTRNRAAKKKPLATFTLNVDSFEQFGLLNLTPPTSLDMVENSIEELKAKKEWYSQQPRGSVPTAQDIRKANEKAAAKLRETPVGKQNGKAKKGTFALSDDDFVPLSANGTSQLGLNSQWGQKTTTDQVESNGISNN